MRCLNQQISNDKCYQVGPLSEIVMNQYCKYKLVKGEEHKNTCHSAEGKCRKKS